MEVYFKEVQSFRNNKWIWLMLVFVFSITVVPVFFAPKETQGIALAIVLFLFLFIGWIFLGSTMSLTIHSKGIIIEFRPFFWAKKTFSPEQIKHWEVRTFSAIGEFGGWGWRKGFSGTGYIVRGKKGLEISYKSNSKLLVSTLLPEELEKAMKKMMNSPVI